MTDGLYEAADRELAWKEEYLGRVWETLQKVYASLKKDPMTKRVGNEGLHLRDQDLLGAAFFDSRDATKLTIVVEDRHGAMVVSLSNPDDLLRCKPVEEVKTRFNCEFAVTSAGQTRGFIVQQGELSQVFPVPSADTPQA